MAVAVESPTAVMVGAAEIVVGLVTNVAKAEKADVPVGFLDVILNLYEEAYGKIPGILYVCWLPVIKLEISENPFVLLLITMGFAVTPLGNGEVRRLSDKSYM